MKNNTVYFSHDSNARRDPKIIELIADHGYEGYGMFWVLIEMLREQEGKLELNKHTIRSLSFELRIDTNECEKFIFELQEYNLIQIIEVENTKFITNKRINESISHLSSVKEKRKKAIEKRWGIGDNSPYNTNESNSDTIVSENDTNVIQLNSESDTIVLQTDTNKIKGNKIKEKNNKKEEKENKEKEEISSPVGEGVLELDFIDSILAVWNEEFKASRQFDFETGAKGKERSAIGKFLGIYKKNNPKQNSLQVLDGMRQKFRRYLTITDPWHHERMTPMHILSNITALNTILERKNGKPATNGNGKIEMLKPDWR